MQSSGTLPFTGGKRRSALRRLATDGGNRWRYQREPRVVADITGKNHEVGLAQAYGTPLILITQDAPFEAPFNIRNLRMIEYARSAATGDI